MKICWLIDDPGWAFGVSLRWISSLSEHEHVYVTTQELNEEPLRITELEVYDVVVCPYPGWLPMSDSLRNVVACLKSKRAFEC
jgi:hypothetical protein